MWPCTAGGRGLRMPRGPRGERCPVDVIGNPVREKLCESQAAEKRGPYKPRQPRAISNWTYRSAFLERMPRQTRHLHAHAVNRSMCGEKERLHVRSAKGEIGRHFGRLDRADMGAVRHVNPGAAGAGAIQGRRMRNQRLIVMQD